MDRQFIIFIMYDNMTDVAVIPEPPFFPTSQTDLHPEWNHGARNVESQCTTEEAKYSLGELEADRHEQQAHRFRLNSNNSNSNNISTITTITTITTKNKNKNNKRAELSL